METLVFYLFGGIALLAAINLVAQKKIFYSALSLIICLAAVAVLYLALDAPFIAAVQIIVYAGAVMVLFLIVIMLLDPFSAAVMRDKRNRLRFLAATLGLAVLLLLFTAIQAYDPSAGPIRADAAGAVSMSLLGETLFRRLLIPFEVTSILILAAIMGVVVLTGKRS